MSALDDANPKLPPRRGCSTTGLQQMAARAEASEHMACARADALAAKVVADKAADLPSAARADWTERPPEIFRRAFRRRASL